MRAAIAAAEVGRRAEARGSDGQRRCRSASPRCSARRRRSSCPTATMANQIALKLHARPGDVLIAEEHSHVVVYEYGGAAVHAGLHHGRPSRRGRAGSRPSRCATAAQPSAKVADQRAVRAVAREHAQQRGRPGLAARRARRRSSATARELRPRRAPRRRAAAERGGRAAASPPAAIAARFDTVTLCLSKGLGCPLGAILAGSDELMERGVAREAPLRRRDAPGGDRRRGAALYALDHHVERLADDHARARRLAEAWPQPGLPVDLERVETNFVQIDVGGSASRGEALASPARGRCRRSRPTIHPTVHPCRDAPRRLRGRRRGGVLEPSRLPSGPVSAPDDARPRARAEARNGAGGAAPAVGAGVPSSATARSSGERVLGLADVARGRAGDDRRTSTASARSRRRSPPFAIMQLRRGGAARRSTTTLRALPSRGAARRRPCGWPCRHSQRAPARAAGRDLGVDEAADARGARGRPRRRRARPRARRAVALLEPRVRAARRGRDARDRRARTRSVLRERILDPLGLVADAVCTRASPRATPVLRRAVLRRRPRRARPRRDRDRRAPPAGCGRPPADLARWGDVPRRRRRRACSRRDVSTRWRACGRWSTRRRGASAGASASSSTGAATGCSRATVARCRGSWPRSSSSADERTGAAVADEHRRRTPTPRRSRSTSPGWRSTRCRACPTRGRRTGRPPPELEPLLGRWWTEGDEIVLSCRGGRFRAELVGGPAGRSMSYVRARRRRSLAGRRGPRARRAAACRARRVGRGDEALLRDVPAHARAVDVRLAGL